MKEEVEKVKVKLNSKQNPPEIIYKLLEDISEERLNRAFDILFEEAIKTV